MTRKPERSHNSHSNLRSWKAGWYLIVAWLVFVTLFVQTSIADQLFALLGGNNASLVFTLFLLVPVAFLALPLFYRFDFGVYSERKTEVSTVVRVFASVALTALLLLLSWYVVYVISFAISASLS